MAKKINKKLGLKPKQFLFDLLIVAVVVMSVITAITFASLTNDISRKARIIEIFSSLKLEPQTYNATGESIFGDKRVYSWDSSRSYASYRSYVRASDVKTTVDDLKKAVTDAGFVFIDNPYPNSTTTELVYQSTKNEYLKMSVSSKSRDDAWFNAAMMERLTDKIDIDPNAGPTSIRIYVNLDDNNY